MRADRERLQDILEAIEAIERYTAPGREAFDRDELVRVWCLRHLEIIGEAVSSISDETRIMQPAMPWKQIVGMRNALIHGYFSVNWNRVWTVIDGDLGALRTAAVDLLARLEKE